MFRLTVNGYTDTNIVQQRAKLRTINDNIVIETPRNRNITLVPGSGGFVVMGKNVIDPNQLYKVCSVGKFFKACS